MREFLFAIFALLALGDAGGFTEEDEPLGHLYDP